MSKNVSANLRRLPALAAALALVLGLTAQPAYAVPEDEPGGVAMFGDAIVARPVGAVMTVLGAATFPGDAAPQCRWRQRGSGRR